MCSFGSCKTRFLSQFKKVRNAFECFVTQVQTHLPKTKRVWLMKINVICTVSVKLQKVLAATANRHTHLWNGISWWKIDLFVMLHTATYAAIPCHLTPPRPATPPYPPPQHEDPIISTMTIVTMNPVEREHKFKIHACRHFMNTLCSINKGNSACPSCTMPW